MNNSSFLYPIPFAQPQYFTFPQFHPTTPYYILPSISYFQEMPTNFKETHGKINIEPIESAPKSIIQQVPTLVNSGNRIQKLKNKIVLKSKGVKKFKVERVRDNKGRYSGVCILPTPPKQKQNPKRNLIISLGNQLLEFTSNRCQSLPLLSKISSDITPQEIEKFYEYIHGIRHKVGYYFNICKLSEIWYPAGVESSEEEGKNRKLFRQVCYQYLNNIMRLALLTSGKIKRASKIYHIKAVRTLMKELVPRNQI